MRRRDAREGKFCGAQTLSFTLWKCRYRKQMEEMQKAFNKTVVKLQNTSRIAEEQVSRLGVRVRSENSSGAVVT